MKKLFLFFLIIPLTSFSYVFTKDFQTGYYWQAFPINMTVTGADFTGKVSQLADLAMKTWEDSPVVGKNVWDLINPTQANTIRWSSSQNDFPGMSMSDTLAIAVRFNQAPYVTKAEIVLNSTHSAFSTVGQSVGARNLNLYKVLVHELGHTIGLDHVNYTDPSSNMPSIMSPTLNSIDLGCSLVVTQLACLEQYLADDDIKGSNAAYNEQVHRQSTGYIFGLTAGTEQKEISKFGTCGTISEISDSDHDSDNFNKLFGFTFSLLIGFLVATSRRFIKIKIF